MFAYIVRRLALMLVTLIGISIIIFVLLRVVPGNIVDILFDAAGFVDPTDKANLEKELGLNLPRPTSPSARNWFGRSTRNCRRTWPARSSSTPARVRAGSLMSRASPSW